MPPGSCPLHGRDCRATRLSDLTRQFDVHFRDSRGDRAFDYITGEQAKSRRLEVFGPGRCSFRMVEHGFYAEHSVWVHGEITAVVIEHDANDPNFYVERPVVAQQFGSAKLKMRRDGSGPVDIGFDMKAAATDAEKKCLAEIGVGLYLWHKGGGFLTVPDDTVEDDWEMVNAPQAAAAASRPTRTAPRPNAPTPVPVGRGGKAPAQPARDEIKASSPEEISAYHLLASEAKSAGFRMSWKDEPERMTNLQIANYSRLLRTYLDKRQQVAS